MENEANEMIFAITTLLIILLFATITFDSTFNQYNKKNYWTLEILISICWVLFFWIITNAV
jgi:hypothetical protein